HLHQVALHAHLALRIIETVGAQQLELAALAPGAPGQEAAEDLCLGRAEVCVVDDRHAPTVVRLSPVGGAHSPSSSSRLCSARREVTRSASPASSGMPAVSSS